MVAAKKKTKVSVKQKMYKVIIIKNPEVLDEFVRDFIEDFANVITKYSWEPVMIPFMDFVVEGREYSDDMKKWIDKFIKDNNIDLYNPPDFIIFDHKSDVGNMFYIDELFDEPSDSLIW